MLLYFCIVLLDFRQPNTWPKWAGSCPDRARVWQANRVWASSSNRAVPCIDVLWSAPIWRPYAQKDISHPPSLLSSGSCCIKPAGDRNIYKKCRGTWPGGAPSPPVIGHKPVQGSLDPCQCLRGSGGWPAPCLAISDDNLEAQTLPASYCSLMCTSVLLDTSNSKATSMPEGHRVWERRSLVRGPLVQCSSDPEYKVHINDRLAACQPLFLKLLCVSQYHHASDSQATPLPSSSHTPYLTLLGSPRHPPESPPPLNPQHPPTMSNNPPRSIFSTTVEPPESSATTATK